MKNPINILILLSPFFLNGASQVHAQDALEIKLKSAETAYNKNHDPVEFFFDRYNCILSMGDSEIPIMEVKIAYSYTRGWGADSLQFEHKVYISCIKFSESCIFMPTWPKEHQKINGSYFGFYTKKEAFDFLNKVNEFVATAKQMGFCERKY